MQFLPPFIKRRKAFFKNWVDPPACTDPAAGREDGQPSPDLAKSLLSGRGSAGTGWAQMLGR